MDDQVRAAMAKWPRVPAVYGRLVLDARGAWRLDGARITHPNSLAFLAENYACDAAGRWFFQNGPQRAFVDLEATPWIFGLDPDGRPITHTGRMPGDLQAVLLDAQARLYLATPLGVGLLRDQDLAEFSTRLRTRRDGDPTDLLTDLLAAPSVPGMLELFCVWDTRRLQVERVDAADLPARFGYDPRPRAQDTAPRPCPEP